MKVYVIVSLWGGNINGVEVTLDESTAENTWREFAECALNRPLGHLTVKEIKEKLVEHYYCGNFDEEVHYYECEL